MASFFFPAELFFLSDCNSFFLYHRVGNLFFRNKLSLKVGVGSLSPLLQQLLIHLWWIRTLLMHPGASLCKNMFKIVHLLISTYCRFDSEMKRMEEEMNKFRSELINRESSSFRKAGTRYLKNSYFLKLIQKLFHHCHHRFEKHLAIARPFTLPLNREQ